MKISVQVEMTEEESNVASALITQLKSLSDVFTTTITSNNGEQSTSTYQSLVLRFRNIIESVGSEGLDPVSEELRKTFEEVTVPSNGGQFIVSDFLEAFTMVVFNGDLVKKEKPIAPYIFLLSRIPEPYKTPVRDQMIQKILKFLTIKRPPDCVRAEFFAHAEAFAALVKLEFVSVKGAVTTVNTLLKKEENRCAAVTMLGKTVEICLDLLTEKCDQGCLNEMMETLNNIKDPHFEYDIQYIKDNMNWVPDPTQQQINTAPPSSIDTLSAPRVVQQQQQQQQVAAGNAPHYLQGHSSYIGHKTVIFALAYHAASDILISGSKDGEVLTWNNQGTPYQSFSLDRHYACSMDVDPFNNMLYLCGVAKENQRDTHPAILVYSLKDGEWELQGVLEKSTTKVISSIKSNIVQRGNTAQFITGETIADSREFSKSVVCFYEFNAGNLGGGSLSKLQPITMFSEHTDIITSLCMVQNTQFCSGSRDCRVLLWDTRTPTKCTTFAGHEGTVTSVSSSVSKNLIVTSGLDKQVILFDLRSTKILSKLPLDDSAVLKVAIANEPTIEKKTMNSAAGDFGGFAAVSTLQGLYHLDLVTKHRRLIQPVAEKPKRYHDLTWNNTGTTLYAAGDDMNIDLYSVVN